MTLPPPLLAIARLTDVDSLANWLAWTDSEIDALVDALRLEDADTDWLIDSLGAWDAALVAVPRAESLTEAEPDAEDESLVVAEWLATLESLAVAAVPESDAADSLARWEVDVVADSGADSLVAPLPGVRTALPSVASVFRFVAVTS